MFKKPLKLGNTKLINTPGIKSTEWISAMDTVTLSIHNFLYMVFFFIEKEQNDNIKSNMTIQWNNVFQTDFSRLNEHETAHVVWSTLSEESVNIKLKNLLLTLSISIPIEILSNME